MTGDNNLLEKFYLEGIPPAPHDLALGYLSTIIPVVSLGITILVAHSLCGMFVGILGSVALVSLAQFGAFCVRADITGVDILHPWVFTGMLFGAMMPYAFAAPAPVMEYIAPAPAVLHAASAQDVEYLMPAPLAYAAPVAAETVGFGSFPVEQTVLPMNWEAELCVKRDVKNTSPFRLAVKIASITLDTE